jgi:hypothetical protein
VARDRASTLLREGTLVDRFTQGLSCITRLDARTAAVAGWDGRVSVLEDLREVARLDIAEAVAS